MEVNQEKWWQCAMPCHIPRKYECAYNSRKERDVDSWTKLLRGSHEVKDAQYWKWGQYDDC